MISYSWAMMAAWFEGEGCIIIDQRQNAPTVVISASCTDEDVIKMIHAAFGGNLSQHSVTSTGKLVWQWRMTGWRAAEFIERIRPFLGARRAAKANEALTWWAGRQAEITERRRWCKHGHLLEGDNVIQHCDKRLCRICRTEWYARYNRKQAEKKRAARQAAFGE